jgi:hypothetical protein
MPSEEDNLTPGARELEAALAALTPASPMMTLAQLEARSSIARLRRRMHLWQSIAAVLALAAGASFLVRPAPRVVEVEKVVLRDRPKEAQPRWEVAQASPVSRPPPVQPDYAYLRLRERVMTRGVESLRASRTAPSARALESVVPSSSAAQVEFPTFQEYLFSGGRS